MFHTLVVGHVRIGGDVAAAGHGAAAHFVNAAVGAHAFEHIGRALPHVGHALVHVRLDIARPAFAPFGVPADQVADRAADVDHAIGVIEHLHVAPVPRDQPHLAIHHADALGDVFQRGREQFAVEAQFLRGFVQQPDHFAQIHAGAAQRRGQDASRRSAADGCRKQAFGVLEQATIGGVAVSKIATALLAVLSEGAFHCTRTDDAFGNGAKVGHRDASAPFAPRAGGALHPRIHEGQAAQALFHRGAIAQAQEHEAADVGQKRPEHAMRQHVPAGQPEQCVRTQPSLLEQTVMHPVRIQPARCCQSGQQQGVEPDGEAGDKAAVGAPPARSTPVQAADDGRRELRRRSKSQQANGGQILLAFGGAVITIGGHRQRGDGGAADAEHEAGEVARGVRIDPAQPQCQRHHQIIGHHRRQRHGRHDHHAGRRRETTDVGHQRQCVLSVRQGQCQYVGVRVDRAVAECGRAGQCDRDHQYGDDGQIRGEQPARLAHVFRVRAFHYAHLELARQAEDRQKGEQQLRQEAGRQRRVAQCGGAEARDEAVGHLRPGKQTHRNEGHELHQRFQRHRQHQAVVMLRGIDLAGAEKDGEHGQKHRQIERRLAQRCQRAAMADAAHHLDAHRTGLELERDVRHGGDQRDHGDQRRQPLGFAVAAADEIGDGRDVLLVRYLHQPFQQPDAKQEQQDRAEIDRQKSPAGRHRRADGAVERPRGAIHRQRQTVDDGAQRQTFGIERPTIAEIRHREQQRYINQRDAQQDPTCDHRKASLVRAPGP